MSIRNLLAGLCCGLLFWFASPYTSATAEQSPPLRIAVLDLDSSDAVPWLGPAVSAALRTKLVGMDDVTLLERERMREILLAKNDKPTTPELLGTDHLLRGTVQLMGAWTDEAAKVRISASIVSSANAKIDGDASFVLDGTVKDFFDMETELATRFAEAIGREPRLLQVRYRESKNLTAKKLFGEGLLKLQAAEAEVGGDSKDVAFEKKRVTAALLRQAVDLFRRAQHENEGTFFARAHTCEGRARELLALSQTDDDKARAVREETVKRFRQDAADAAPALYDLAQALAANAEFEKAFVSFEDYRKWMDETFRVIRYRRREVPNGRTQMPAFFGTNVPLVHNFERIAATPSYLLVGGVARMLVLRREDNKVMWERSLPGESRNALHSGHHVLNANDEILAFVNGQTLHVVATPTGEEILKLTLDLPTASDKHLMDHTLRNMTYLFGKGETVTHIGVERRYRNTATGKPARRVLHVVDLETKQLAWSRRWEGGSETFHFHPLLHAGVFICRTRGETDVEYLDAYAGTDAAERVPAPLKKLLAAKDVCDRPILILPDAQSTHHYIAIRDQEDAAVPVRLLRLKSDGIITPITDIMYLHWPVHYTIDRGDQGFLNRVDDGPAKGDWLSYDFARKGLIRRSEELPEIPEKWHWGGYMYDDLLWLRRKSSFRAYRLVPDGKPDYVFEYTHPWIVQSRPVFDAKSFYLFVTLSGVGGHCDLLEIGIPPAGRGRVSEPMVLGDIATCHDRLGRFDKAAEALEAAVECHYNQPEYHWRLAQLYEKQDKGGECSFFCESLIDLVGKESEQGRKALSLYNKVLGRIEGIPQK